MGRVDEERSGAEHCELREDRCDKECARGEEKTGVGFETVPGDERGEGKSVDLILNGLYGGDE